MLLWCRHCLCLRLAPGRLRSSAAGAGARATQNIGIIFISEQDSAPRELQRPFYPTCPASTNCLTCGTHALGRMQLLAMPRLPSSLVHVTLRARHSEPDVSVGPRNLSERFLATLERQRQRLQV